MLDMCIWLEVSHDVALHRRMARSVLCNEEHFDQMIWANHEIYKRNVFERVEEKLYEISGEERTNKPAKRVAALMKQESSTMAEHIEKACDDVRKHIRRTLVVAWDSNRQSQNLHER